VERVCSDAPYRFVRCVILTVIYRSGSPLGVRVSAEVAPLVLASSSARRRELLAALRVPFIVRPMHTEEVVQPGLAPPEVVLRIAAEKAAAAAAVVPRSGCLIAADTIVALEDRILGKPADAAAARAMLGALAGRAHDVYTAVVVAAGGRQAVAVAETNVLMRPLSAEEIETSIAAGTPLDKAGGYAIQDEALRPVLRFSGCYCNVMGLPLWTVHRLLHQLCPELRPEPPDTVYERCRHCPLQERGG